MVVIDWTKDESVSVIKMINNTNQQNLEFANQMNQTLDNRLEDKDIRTIHSKWLKMDPRQMDQRASQLLEKRLSEYQKPDIDPAIETDLIKYLEMKKK